MIEIKAEANREKQGTSVSNKTEGVLEDIIEEGLAVIQSILEQMKDTEKEAYELFVAEAGLLIVDRFHAINEARMNAEPQTETKGGDTYAS